ncbi:MAG: hypothetical protein V3T86_02230 [Planctomycetota bacterium]
MRAGDAQPVRRHVIALYDGARNPYVVDPVHDLLETPLNHLGLIPLRHDIRKGPPPAEWLEKAHAILFAFVATDQECPWLWPWVEKHADPSKRRVVLFGGFGPLIVDSKESPDPDRLGRWLSRFGLGYDHYYASGIGVVEVDLLEEDSTSYEATPLGHSIHRGPWIEDKSNKAWISTRGQHDAQKERHPIVVGPWGGLVLDPWTLERGRVHDDRRWFVDPFRFLRDALGMKGVPAPHPSVLNGRRMFFVQVDGDGFEDISTIHTRQYSAKVMHEDVFQKYALPFTVSVIIRSLTLDYEAPEPTDRMKLARRILNQPNIEVASHGVLHTLRWRRPLKVDSAPRTIMWYAKLQNYAYSPLAEVSESIRFINERLMENGKRCEVMLWTGMADPLANVVRQSRASGCWNLNGGVFRWDPLHDSVAFVSPWGRIQEDTVQVYAGGANENDFEGFYDTMPGAFKAMDLTIERTGKGRILKPADVYIHFYSADNRPRLRSVHYLIQRWAFREPTAPVFASTYARAVHSALTGAHILRTDNGWILRDFGDCKTIRIDEEPRNVDFLRSKGLLGARRIGDSLYIHLARPDAVLVLADSPQLHPHVIEANHTLEDAGVEHKRVFFRSRAHSRREILLGGFPKDTEVQQTLDGKSATVRTDADGRLRIVFEKPGETVVEVSLP